ncbi:MAG: ClpXP protease specificity-enhancing factor SspB [Leptospiraceae bacterium]|nr:ClpXP protease specificity-enhancing factor SspB [Leptospiraceae bacterium]
MEDKISSEELKYLRDFKSRLFDLYWEKFGFFYIHVLPHPSLEMGARGLIGKETESGVVLAFGQSACKDISSQSDYLFAELQFGFKWEKLIIPWDAVFRIFDKSQNSVTQLRVIFDEPIFEDNKQDKTEVKSIKKSSADSKVIEIDFSSKKK